MKYNHMQCTFTFFGGNCFSRKPYIFTVFYYKGTYNVMLNHVKFSTIYGKVFYS